MKWLDRKRKFVRRRPQLSLFISFIKGLIIGLLICHFMGSTAEAQTYNVGDTLTFKVSGLVCSFCAHGLNKGIGKLDYTDKNNVFVDINNQIVKVVILKEPNIEETIKVITDSGYDISKITHKGKEIKWIR